MTKNTRKNNGKQNTDDFGKSVSSKIGQFISSMIAPARSDAIQNGEKSKFYWLRSQNFDQHMTNAGKLLDENNGFPELKSKQDLFPPGNFLLLKIQDGVTKEELLKNLNEILETRDTHISEEDVKDLGLVHEGNAGEKERRFFAVDVTDLGRQLGLSNISNQGGENVENSKLGSKITSGFQKMHDDDMFLRDIEMKCAFGGKQQISKTFGNTSANGLEDGQTYFSIECPNEEVQGVQMGMIVSAIATKLAGQIEGMGQSQYSEDDLIKGKSSEGKPIFSIKVG